MALKGFRLLKNRQNTFLYLGAGVGLMAKSVAL